MYCWCTDSRMFQAVEQNRMETWRTASERPEGDDCTLTCSMYNVPKQFFFLKQNSKICTMTTSAL